VHELAPDLYVEEATVRFYGANLRTRMAVLRLEGDRLLVYSPIALSPKLRRDLEDLGQVSFVLAPNKIHNQALLQWERAFPSAMFCLPPGLAERRPGLRCDLVLGAGPQAEWSNEVDQAMTAGNCFFSEVLLYHRSSRTLLVADLVENVGRETASSFARWLARPFGLRERPAPSPEFRLYTHDAAAARASLERPRSWKIELVFLCHGAILREKAGWIFDEVCEELIEVAERRSDLGKKVLAWIARLQ
jgi:hypothetical protein